MPRNQNNVDAIAKSLRGRFPHISDEDILHRLESLNHALASDAMDEIERLRKALWLAVGELSTHGEYAAQTPEMLLNQFMEEADRG